MNPI
jgi:hypothetical protein